VWSRQSLLTRTDEQQLGVFSLNNNRLVMAVSARVFDQVTNPQTYVRRPDSCIFEQELASLAHIFASPQPSARASAQTQP
jgi:hypothetical protein